MSSDEGNSGSTGVDDFSQMNTPNAWNNPDGFNASRDGFGGGSQAAADGFSAPNLGEMNSGTTGVSDSMQGAIDAATGGPRTRAEQDAFLNDVPNVDAFGPKVSLQDVKAVLEAVEDLPPMDDWADEDYGTYDKPVGPDLPGTPNNFYDIQQYQKAEKDTEDWKSDFASLFGVGSPLEYDEQKGWHEGTSASLGSVLTSPVGGIAGAALGLPMGIGLAAKGFDYLTEKPTAEVLDYTKDYGDEAYFGGTPFTEEQTESAFGDDGAGADAIYRSGSDAIYRSGQRRPMTAPRTILAPEPEEPTGPTDPRSYIKQYQSWTGNKFNLAPLVRRS